MTTTVEKCPTCGGDAINRSEYWESVCPNGDELRVKIFEIEKAIKKYYLALDERQHGELAMDKAFREIQNVLGMRWVRGDMKKELIMNPRLAEIYKD